MDRMGDGIMLSVIHTVTIGTMPTNNNANNGHGLNKKTLFVNRPYLLAFQSGKNTFVKNQYNYH